MHQIKLSTNYPGGNIIFNNRKGSTVFIVLLELCGGGFGCPMYIYLLVHKRGGSGSLWTGRQL